MLNLVLLPKATALSPYLLSSFPKRVRSEGKTELVFKYLGPQQNIEPNLPNSQEAFVRLNGINILSNVVTDNQVLDHDLGKNAKFRPGIILWEVEVRCALIGDSSAAGSPEKEREIKSLNWTEVELPLESHRAFLDDGEYEFSDEDWEHYFGWKNETDPKLKSSLKYIPRDALGNEVGGETEVTGNAVPLCKLLRRGFEYYSEYYPIWQIDDTYRGFNAPNTGNIGLKEDPVGGGYPGGYEWRSADDSSTLQGDSSTRWRRSRKWQGGHKIWYDRNTVYAY